MPRPNPQKSPNSTETQGHPARLSAIDGWRAIAVVGVLWWHSWIHTGNPSLNLPIAGRVLNLERLGVVLGNGVHLFFVLSGFCICLSLARMHKAANGLREAAQFIAHRWLRLSPAFYGIMLVTALTLAAVGEAPLSANQLFAHLAWLGGLWPGGGWLSPAFWSLRVEWEFYLLAPLVIVPLVATGAARGILIALGLSLGYSYYAHCTPDGTAWQQDEHLPVHFAAFFWGVVAADGWLKGRSWFGAMKGWRVLLFGFVMAFTGRGLGSTDVFFALGRWGALGKTLGEPLMTFGFMTMIAASLHGGSSSALILGNRVIQWIGKRSYSLYLWHWWPCLWIGHALRAQWGVTPGAHYATLGLSLAVCLPLSWLSYRFLEQPYFRKPVQAS